MVNNLNNIEFIFPREPDLKGFIQMSTEEPFSENAISFLNAFSICLKNEPKISTFPEIATLAFFCRKSNLIQLKKHYYPQNNLRIGRGIVFHITPSNVPVNFVYSLISGILSGNLNIVKITSKKFEQIDIICNAFHSLTIKPEFQAFSKRILLIRYDKQNAATSYFSSICNARIIWGNNTTIHDIQKNTLASNAFDITFADKYSICVINANNYIHERSPQKIAQQFYNDTFLFDQNACTSPHLIVWLGTDQDVADSKQIFWNNLHDLVKKRYHFHPNSAIDKLITFYNQAIHLEGIKKIPMPDNLIWRIELPKLSADIEKYRCNCGYFLEYKTNSLTELSNIISNKHQTIAYYGIKKEDLMQIATKKNLNTIDGIVPIGKTSDFSLSRDGCNLINTLSKVLK